ncbi:acriflavine resistance protein [Actinobacillus pleuropneumoniae]|nr:acriflavine resistance protein [Actinobacillus pleuropneumoniae]
MRAVLSALSANNLNTAAGNANGYYTVYKNKVESSTPSVEELENVTISTLPTVVSLNLKILQKLNWINIKTLPELSQTVKKRLY